MDIIFVCIQSIHISSADVNKGHSLIKLSESKIINPGLVAFSELPEPVKVFSAIWELEGHVNGGGFDEIYVAAHPDDFGPVPDDVS